MIEITDQTLPDIFGDIEKIIEKITQITNRQQLLLKEYKRDTVTNMRKSYHDSNFEHFVFVGESSSRVRDVSYGYEHSMVIEKSRLEHYNTAIASLLPGAYTFDLGPLGQLSNWDTIKFSTFHFNFINNDQRRIGPGGRYYSFYQSAYDDIMKSAYGYLLVDNSKYAKLTISSLEDDYIYHFILCPNPRYFDDNGIGLEVKTINLTKITGDAVDGHLFKDDHSRFLEKCIFTYKCLDDKNHYELK